MPGASFANHEQGHSSAAPVDALRRFTRNRAETPAPTASPARKPVEHCELCSEPIPSVHRHLLELPARTLVCTCDACTILFGNEGAGAGRYRVVSRRSLALPDFQISDGQWEELSLPVNMVYMFWNSVEQRITAYYPSPAGAMESLLNLEQWEELTRDNPVLADLTPDVEALLINRVKDSRQYYIVPIDVCYRLVGLIRLSWKGLGGGDEVWKAIADFFAELRTTAQTVKGGTDA